MRMGLSMLSQKMDHPQTRLLKRLHPDKEFGEMSMEGAVVDDDWAMLPGDDEDFSGRAGSLVTVRAPG
jgi:hypothetical protein